MITRYRTSSTIETRTMRRSLLPSQGLAVFGKQLGMILCVDGTGIGHQQYWLNGKASAIVNDSPRFAGSYANLLSNDANGEPSRAWSQGRQRKWERKRPQ